MSTLVLEGEAERPRPAAAQRGMALTLGLILFKAELFSMFDCTSEQLLIFDAGQIPAHGFPGCWCAQVMVLQGCDTPWPSANAFSSGNWAAVWELALLMQQLLERTLGHLCYPLTFCMTLGKTLCYLVHLLLTQNSSVGFGVRLLIPYDTGCEDLTDTLPSPAH